MTSTVEDHYTEILNRIAAQDKAAIKAQTLMGRIVRHPYADGYAVYEITAVRATQVELTAVEGLDYTLPAWGNRAWVPLKTVEPFLRQAEGWLLLQDTQENWWNARTEGEILHYHNGGNSWVRGIVTADKQLKPVALVGDWRPYDLPRRQSDGSVYLGYHAKKIAEGDAWRPNYSTMFEFTGTMRGLSDPRGLPAVDLSVPPLSTEQRYKAGLERKRAAMLKALEIGSAANAIDEAVAIGRAPTTGFMPGADE